MKSNFCVDCNGRVEPLFRNLDGISSQKYNKTTPSFEFLSNLYGVQNPFNVSLAEENESSSLVYEISNMSILVSMMEDNTSNLFLFELTFPWPTLLALSMGVLHQDYCRFQCYHELGIILL